MKMKLDFYKNKNFYFCYELPENLDKEVLNQFTSLRKAMNGKSLELCNKIQGLDILLNGEVKPKTIMETCGGLGVSAEYLKNKYPNSDLSLNEYNLDFYDILKDRFDNVTMVDCMKKEYIENLKYVDLIFLDFPHFSFKLDYVVALLLYLKKTDILLVTDVYSFSLIPFNKKKYISYIEKINYYLSNTTSYSVTECYLYQNKKVSILKIEKNKNTDLIIHEPDKIYWDIHRKNENELFSM